jgi:hypothetical protein
MPRSADRNTAAIAAFLVTAIDNGSRLLLQDGPPNPFVEAPRVARFEHLPAGIVRGTARALHALGIDGEAALDLIMEHAVPMPQAAGQLRCSAAEVVSLLDQGQLGGLSAGGDWLVSGRGIERLAMVARAEKWLRDDGSDFGRKS